MWKPTLLVLLLLPTVALAQAGDGWSKFGEVLGGGTRRSDAYEEGRRQQAEYSATIEEARQHQLEAESRDTNERIRANLRQSWERAGLTAAQASSIASTYKWTESQTAIIDGVRSRGAATAIEPMRTALRDYNYPLANQLMIAYLIASNEDAARREGTAPTNPTSGWQ